MSPEDLVRNRTDIYRFIIGAASSDNYTLNKLAGGIGK